MVREPANISSTRSAALQEDVGADSSSGNVHRSVRRNRNSFPVNMNQRQGVRSGANFDLRNESGEQEEPLLEEGNIII